jgi:cell division protein FtsQ
MSLYSERRQASSLSSTQRRDRRDIARRPLGFKLFLLGILVCLGIWGWLHFSEIRLFPINSVVINGNSGRIDQQEVKKVLLSFLSQNNFLTLRTGQMREQLLQVPWVGTASVSRAWPAKLVIYLTERDVVARWNEQYFMGADGKVFPVKTEQAYRHLPVLTGPEGQQVQVWQQYKMMNQAFAPTGLNITHLALSSRQAWRVQLANGVVLVLGRADPLAKVQRAAQMYTKVIGSRGDEVEYVDLRYTNAIAVRWKQQDPEILILGDNRNEYDKRI